MRTFRRIRRAVATALLVALLPACYQWYPGYLAPSELTKKTVRVTTMSGDRVWLYAPWIVRGDTLLVVRDQWSFVTKDTIRIAVADVAAVKGGGYDGTFNPDRTIPLLLAGKGPKAGRVTIGRDRFQLLRPWVSGDSLLGYRRGGARGNMDTIAVPLAAIRRLEVYRASRATWQVPVALVLGLGALVAALGVSCGQSCFYSGY